MKPLTRKRKLEDEMKKDAFDKTIPIEKITALALLREAVSIHIQTCYVESIEIRQLSRSGSPHTNSVKIKNAHAMNARQSLLVRLASRLGIETMREELEECRRALKKREVERAKMENQISVIINAPSWEDLTVSQEGDDYYTRTKEAEEENAPVDVLRDCPECKSVKAGKWSCWNWEHIWVCSECGAKIGEAGILLK